MTRLMEVSEAGGFGGLAGSKGGAMMARRFQEWSKHAL